MWHQLFNVEIWNIWRRSSKTSLKEGEKESSFEILNLFILLEDLEDSSNTRYLFIPAENRISWLDAGLTNCFPIRNFEMVKQGLLANRINSNGNVNCNPFPSFLNPQCFSHILQTNTHFISQTQWSSICCPSRNEWIPQEMGSHHWRYCEFQTSWLHVCHTETQSSHVISDSIGFDLGSSFGSLEGTETFYFWFVFLPFFNTYFRSYSHPSFLPLPTFSSTNQYFLWDGQRRNQNRGDSGKTLRIGEHSFVNTRRSKALTPLLQKIGRR